MSEASIEGEVVSVVERAIREQAHNLTRAGRRAFIPDPDDPSQRVLDQSFGPLIRMGRIAAPDISGEKIASAVISGVESAEAALAAEQKGILDAQANRDRLLAEKAKLRKDFLEKSTKTVI